MRFLCILLVCLCGFKDARAATVSMTCLEALKVPGRITRTPKERTGIEVEFAGSFYRVEDGVPLLERGAYVFLITTQKELLIAKKYGPNGLATHPAMLRMFEQRTGRSMENEIAAAGEFVVAFGEITLLTNRSGNYRAGKEYLDFAQEFLRAKGIRFGSDVIVTAFDPSKPALFGHTPKSMELDQFQLMIRQDFKDNPRLGRIMNLYNEMVLLFEQIYPNAEDRTKVYDDLKKGQQSFSDIMGRAYFTSSLSYIGSVDGLEYGVWSLAGKIRESNMGEDTEDVVEMGDLVANQIDCLIRGGRDHMTEVQLAQLGSLAARFKAVGPIERRPSRLEQ